MSPYSNTNEQRALRHLAISPDGNRRWATVRGHEKADGYDAGLSVLPGIIDTVRSEGIRYLSLHVMNALSWGRPDAELRRVMSVVASFIDDLATENDLVVHWVGRRAGVPSSLRRQIEDLERREVPSPTLTVILYLDYDYSEHLAAGGGRLETLDPVGVPPVDLYIRTSDDQRTSGFDPLRVAYSELAFVSGGFPSFTGDALAGVLDSFHGRTRTFGV